MKKLWMSWSTGKDSAYALYELQKRSDVAVTGLFTTVTDTYNRVSMHATREALLHQQAENLGLSLKIVRIPTPCSNQEYENKMRALIKDAQSHGVTAMGFGDLYLEDVKSFREALLRDTGIEPVFPLWKRPTQDLAVEMHQAGIGAVLTCVDPRKIPSAFVGRVFDADLLRDLPAGVDPCGENGEFHTFVYASPSFKREIDFSVGEIVERDGFVFADIVNKSDSKSSFPTRCI